MSHVPAVSVVVATYNRARLLCETIESILQQRFSDYELIVVDDGSTDHTREALGRFESRLRYLYQENKGPSAARNLGVQHAKGQWLSIQDSDDLCTPNHLERLYQHAKEHPGCGMIFANGRYLGEPEHRRETIIPPAKSHRLAAHGVQLRDIFDKSLVRLQAALIAKTAYQAVGGHDESLRICMDLDLSFRLLMNFPVAYVDEVVFLYRKHQGNISRNQEQRLAENIRVIEKLLDAYPGARDLLGDKRVAFRLAYRYYRLAKLRWRTKQWQQARKALQMAVSLRPLSLKYRFYQLQWNTFLRQSKCH